MQVQVPQQPIQQPIYQNYQYQPIVQYKHVQPQYVVIPHEQQQYQVQYHVQPQYQPVQVVYQSGAQVVS